MKLPDPDIQTGPWEEVREGVQRNLDRLASAMPGTAGQTTEIRFGTSSVTFTASVDSAVTAVTHGLGRVPQAITFGSNNGSTVFVWSNKTATTFDLTGKYDAAVTGTAVTDWIAIG